MMTLLNPFNASRISDIWRTPGVVGSDVLGGAIGFVGGKLVRFFALQGLKMLKLPGAEPDQFDLAGLLASAAGIGIPLALGAMVDDEGQPGVWRGVKYGAYISAIHNLLAPAVRAVTPTQYQPAVVEALGLPYFETLGAITASDTGGSFSPNPILGEGYALKALGDEPSMYNAVAVGDEDSVQLVAMH